VRKEILVMIDKGRWIDLEIEEERRRGGEEERVP
jgi:hypothetical protein